MKIKDIVMSASKMCNVELPDRYFYEDLSGDETGAKTDTTVKKFVSCCNLVLDELACDYAPVLRQKTLQSINGFMAVEDGESVVSLSVGGKAVFFRETNGGVNVPDGSYVAVVSVRPPKSDFDDDVVVGSTRLTDRIVAYGVSAEYCLLQGNYADATLWDKRFKDALALANVKHREIKMPARRWC